MYSYCSYYDYYDYSDYDVISALVGLTGLAVIWVIALLLIALMIVAMWILFKKAGKPGWAAVVPFYDQYTLYEITWGNGWRFLMLLIPIYNIVLAILTYIRLAKAFGKDEGIRCGTGFPASSVCPHAGLRQRGLSWRAWCDQCSCSGIAGMGGLSAAPTACLPAAPAACSTPAAYPASAAAGFRVPADVLPQLRRQGRGQR